MTRDGDLAPQDACLATAGSTLWVVVWGTQPARAGFYPREAELDECPVGQAACKGMQI